MRKASITILLAIGLILILLVVVPIFNPIISNESGPSKKDAAILFLNQLSKKIVIFREKNDGRLPERIDHVVDLSQLVDPWGQTVTYRVSDREFSITSSGPDMIQGTTDDLIFTKNGIVE